MLLLRIQMAFLPQFWSHNVLNCSSLCTYSPPASSSPHSATKGPSLLPAILILLNTHLCLSNHFQ